MTYQCVSRNFPTSDDRPPPKIANAAQVADRGGVAKAKSEKHSFADGYKPGATSSASLTAIIRSDPSRRGRYWNIEFDGAVLVSGSREPELDLARVLLARGVRGSITIIDGESGRPRVIIRDIAKAARLTVKEGPNGPRFVKRPKTYPVRAPAAEKRVAGTPVPEWWLNRPARRPELPLRGVR